MRVSWEQALDLIDAQHRRIRDSYGPASIFAGSYGWRSNGVLHKAATLLQRYMSLAGGYTGHLGDYSTGAAQAIMPTSLAAMRCISSRPVGRWCSSTAKWWCCGAPTR